MIKRTERNTKVLLGDNDIYLTTALIGWTPSVGLSSQYVADRSSSGFLDNEVFISFTDKEAILPLIRSLMHLYSSALYKNAPFNNKLDRATEYQLITNFINTLFPNEPVKTIPEIYNDYKSI